MKNCWIHIALMLCILSCSENTLTDSEPSLEDYEPTPIALQIPTILEQKLIAPVMPSANPQTVEGIALGKKLFYDTILSGDNTMACASCHAPESAFTNNLQFSIGIDGIEGSRNSMPIFNLAWNFNERFMWDGSELSLERQALEPVTNPIEMHANWADIVIKLELNEEYPELFNLAFGKNTTITKELAGRAIAQFERTLISADSRFDKYLLGEVNLSPEEINGFNVFMDEDRGDCFHCHGDNNNPLWTDNIFHNNGLDESFTDLGLGGISGDPIDNGKFRTPSMRNLAYTAPYMHDGRFKTLEEVINHYSEGLKRSVTIDPLMKKVDEGGANLTPKDKADLKAFLLTLSDTEFINNLSYQKK